MRWQQTAAHTAVAGGRRRLSGRASYLVRGEGEQREELREVEDLLLSLGDPNSFRSVRCYQGAQAKRCETWELGVRGVTVFVSCFACSSSGTRWLFITSHSPNRRKTGWLILSWFRR